MTDAFSTADIASAPVLATLVIPSIVPVVNKATSPIKEIISPDVPPILLPIPFIAFASSSTFSFAVFSALMKLLLAF